MEITFTTETNKYISGNIFDNFEENSGWTNPYLTDGSIGLDYLSTRFIISNAKKKSGKNSGKLEYRFLGIEAICKIDNDNIAKISSNQNFGIWVFGDNSKPEIIENIIPYRKEGRFYCLPHIDEGFINGGWAKGETTARNEKRFVTEMQQGKLNHKEDGLKNILETMDIVNIDDSLYPNTKFINVKMK